MRWMTTAGTTAAAVLTAAVVLTGCSSTGNPQSRVVTVTKAPVTHPAAHDTPTGKSRQADAAATSKPAAKTTLPAASRTAARASWRMPDETGKVLQTAQDDIQALTGDGIFFTHSHDVTGAGRFQILDRDWKVCGQNIAPGRTITAASDIVFDVVKLSETCP